MFGMEVVKLVIEGAIIPWICADDCDENGNCDGPGVYVGTATRPV